jgi:hypothetical protein
MLMQQTDLDRDGRSQYVRTVSQKRQPMVGTSMHGSIAHPCPLAVRRHQQLTEAGLAFCKPNGTICTSDAARHTAESEIHADL